MQRELAKRAKERQKLSELDAARLEVETLANELEVILSIHWEGQRPCCRPWPDAPGPVLMSAGKAGNSVNPVPE